MSATRALLAPHPPVCSCPQPYFPCKLQGLALHFSFHANRMPVPQLLQHETAVFLPGLSHSSLPFRGATSILLDAQGLDSAAFLLLRLCQVKVSYLWARGERRGSCGLPSTAPPPSFCGIGIVLFPFLGHNLCQIQAETGPGQVREVGGGWGGEDWWGRIKRH